MKKKQKQVRQVIEEPTENLQPKIYIGPTVLPLGLVSNRVYCGGDVMGNFAQAREKYPLVMQLVVPVDKLHTAKEAMREKGTPQYLAFKQITRGGK